MNPARPSGGLTAQSPATVLTIAHGMQVLRAFRSDRAPLSNSELVRRTGQSKASVSRFTSTLLQLGYLRRVAGSRAFELAAAPLAVGHAFIAGSELLQTANPFLQRLADRLGVSVALAVADGHDMLYIAYKAGSRVATLRLGVGSVLPMASTSIGRAYLWGLPPARQKRVIAELRKSAGSQGTALERSIRDSFTELQTTGTCGVLAGFQRGAYGVALPVRIGREQVVMGLSCGKAEVQPDLAAERERIAPVLKAAAPQLEALLADFDGQA